jgi:RNA polymerase sigma-70 factor (sigma-E family)
MRSSRDAEFTTFVATRSATLVHAAYRMCGDRDVAEDLVQTALEKAYQRWHGIELEDPYGYVRRVVLNQHLTRLRRKPWRERPVGGTDELDDWSAQTADPTTAVDHRITIETALAAHLTRRERHTVVMRYLEGRSEAETAAVLGVAVGTVKSTTSIALGKLRRSPYLRAEFCRTDMRTYVRGKRRDHSAR